jgi:hypothetical protein
VPSTPYTFISQPGVRRDGTELDSPYYADGVWVRWQRGKPRKMGGYRVTSQIANGPVRSIMVDSRNGITSAHCFGPWGIQRLQLSASGAGGALEDRSPLGFAYNALLTLTHGILYSTTGGAYAALLAAATPDLDDITSDTTGSVYVGNATDSSLMSVVSDGGGPIAVSGGLAILQPFLVVYGSNGLLRNTNPNDFSSATGWTAGGGNYANTANVAGTKIVYGAPVRGGSQSPAGLFWALDALVRMSFVGGTNIWQYDTLSCPTTLLSKKAIVEHDGKFFWPGVDRFLFYAGTVQELPNDMNLNYFYDNLNYAARNKVWGTKIQRFGEIWWFYPRGAATECTDAIIFNYKENTWYDAKLLRSAGDKVQTFQFPVWAGTEDGQASVKLNVGTRLVNSAQTLAANNTLNFSATPGVVNGMVVTGHAGIPTGTTISSHTGTTAVMSNVATSTIPAGTVLTFSSMTQAFVAGSTATGGTSGATGKVLRETGTDVNVAAGGGTFVSGETITGSGGATAVLQAAPVAQQLDAVYQHEFGYDKIAGQNPVALKSSFTSQNFGFASGAPFGDAPRTVNLMTRLTRVEPDFNQVGPITLQVEGRSFAQDANAVLASYNAQVGDSFIDIRDAQERILRMTIISDTLGGFFEQGQVLCELEPGDERSTKDT